MDRMRAIRPAVGLAIISGLLFACSSGSRPIDRAPAPDARGCGGTLTSLSAAGAALPFTLVLPSTELANGDNMNQVVLCSSDQVELDFGSGVIVTLGVNHLVDPPKEWATLAEEYPEFSTGTVGGVPASLADPAKGALGGVDLVEGGVRMTVTGDGTIPLSDLIAVAESIQAAFPPTPSATQSTTAPSPTTSG
jgi:hypothetical protein